MVEMTEEPQWTAWKAFLEAIEDFRVGGIARNALITTFRNELDLHSSFTWIKFLREGIDSHFNAKAVDLNRIESLAQPSDYWTQDTYGGTPGTTAFDCPGKITVPSNLAIVSIHSKNTFNYPRVVARAKLPTLTGYSAFSAIWIGVEGGARSGYGLASFYYYTPDGGVGTEILQARLCYMEGLTRSVVITNLLPTTFRTKDHVYSVEVTRSMIIYWIDDDVVAYGLITPSSFFTSIQGPPYGLFSIERPFSSAFPAFIEVQGSGQTLEFQVAPFGFRVSHGDPLPPRIIRVYDESSTTLWAGMSVSNGVTVTSHPFPLNGFDGKTIDFQATVAGTLYVDVYMQTGNWRIYPPNAGTAILANVLESFDITGQEILGRIRFTPNADGLISDAEVHLR